MIDQGDKSVNGLVNLQLFYFFSFPFFLFIYFFFALLEKSMAYTTDAWFRIENVKWSIHLQSSLSVSTIKTTRTQIVFAALSDSHYVQYNSLVYMGKQWVGNLQHDEMCSSWKCLLSWFGPKLIWSVGSGSLISLLIKSFSSWGRAKRQVSVK